MAAGAMPLWLVRYFSAARTAPYIRVTIGTIEEMRAFIEKTQEVLREATP